MVDVPRLRGRSPHLTIDVHRFCDAMLARLARWRRAGGYDAELRSEEADRQLIDRCRAE
jgi:uncharacterized protein with PIN domain